MKDTAIKLNHKLYYGWVIVLVSALGVFFSAPGQTYSISVFIDAYGETFDYSSTLISSGYSVATVISGMLIVFMGRFTDKFGQRVMMVTVGILLAITTFFNSFVANIGMMFVGFFLLRYFGQGSMTLIPSSLVPQWFDKKRGFALSLMHLGAVLATLLVPRFNLYLIESLGWENAWRMWGILLLVIFVPLAWIFVIDKPEDIDMTVENEHHEDEAAAQKALERMEAESFSLSEAIKTAPFWLAGLISMIAPMFTTGVTFHFFSIMEMRSVDKESAAIIIGLIALPAFIMPLIAKSVVDRLPFRIIFMIIQTGFLISMAWLAFFVTGFISATGFILFYGTAFALQSVSMNTLWPTFFGRKHLGSIRGAGTIFMVIGSALGPVPFGVSKDVTGDYNAAIFIMMGMSFIALLMASVLKNPEKTEIAN
ncbi:MAG: MFS transporter [Bacillota bacterium]